MAAERTRIAVIGADIGGLTVASCLLRLGFSVEVYEQASQFGACCPDPARLHSLSRQLVAIEQNKSSATLIFSNGSRVDALLVLGADGIHSMVRETASSNPLHRSRCLPHYLSKNAPQSHDGR